MGKQLKLLMSMNIRKRLKELYVFLTTDILSKRITSAASALTYSTLLAIVPILAVVFGIARGFGYNKYIFPIRY